MFKAFAGGLEFATPDQAASVFTPIVSASKGQEFSLCSAHALFVAAAAAVVFAGVRNGIEKSSKILMPLLFILLGALVLRGVSLPGASKGLRFFLSPNFKALGPESVLIAMGQAFFTLSLAMGITMTYGSYLKRDVNIVRSSLLVIGLDTLAAILAGIAIFSSVFAMKLDPAQGPGLVYMVVPSAFNLTVWYEDRFEVRLGTTDDLAYKLEYLKVVIQEQKEYTTGIIDLTFSSGPEAHVMPNED